MRNFIFGRPTFEFVESWPFLCGLATALAAICLIHVL